jgi:SAM-dependent methyltransferase
VPVPWESARAELRGLLTDADRLVRAVAAGRRRGSQPRWVRATLRPVSLKAGTRLQLTTDDGTRPTTRNLAWGGEVESTVDELLAQPFGNWHIDTRDGIVQVRVTKRGEAQIHRESTGSGLPTGVPAARAHDEVPAHILDPGDPLFDVIGGTAAKRRQVDAFLRSLAATLELDGHQAAGSTPSGSETALPSPLRVVDMGCGNAYLTFAAYRFLSTLSTVEVELTGVDMRDDQRRRNTELAHSLGWQDRVRFTAATIARAPLDDPHVVLALHACDTATDEALARAVQAGARWIVAAPCCHHDVARQLRANRPPAAYEILTRHGILRERFADVLTDALRAALLRLHGYRVDVVEFIDSRHTPRNVMLRARRTHAPASPAAREEYDHLVAAWGIRPYLATLLDRR